MRRPRVTIVTPSYNQGAFLEETIQSVLAQDYEDIEYIVIDDGSTDGSLEIVERFADRLTWWTTQSNAGQVAALMRGFERATGDLLGWINSDDCLLPGAVTAVVEAYERCGGDALLVYGDNVLTDAESVEIGLLPARDARLETMLRLFENPVPQPGSLFPRRALDEVGGLAREGYYYFDFELVLELALRGPLIRLERPLGTYRLHPDSKSVSQFRRKADDQLRVIDAFFSHDLPPDVRALERLARANCHVAAGEHYYAAGDRVLGRSHLLHGLRLEPRMLTLRTAGVFVRTLLPPLLVGWLRKLRGR